MDVVGHDYRASHIPDVFSHHLLDFSDDAWCNRFGCQSLAPMICAEGYEIFRAAMCMPAMPECSVAFVGTESHEVATEVAPTG